MTPAFVLDEQDGYSLVFGAPHAEVMMWTRVRSNFRDISEVYRLAGPIKEFLARSIVTALSTGEIDHFSRQRALWR